MRDYANDGNEILCHKREPECAGVLGLQVRWLIGAFSEAADNLSAGIGWLGMHNTSRDGEMRSSPAAVIVNRSNTGHPSIKGRIMA